MASRCPTELFALQADRLWAAHGELMDSRALTKLFKFGSDRSFRRSAEMGTLPVPVFRLLGRKGWFARTADVAQWLAMAGQVADGVAPDLPESPSAGGSK